MSNQNNLSILLSLMLIPLTFALWWFRINKPDYWQRRTQRFRQTFWISTIGSILVIGLYTFLRWGPIKL